MHDQPKLWIGNEWKSPNIDFKLILWRSTPKNIEALGKGHDGVWHFLFRWAAATPFRIPKLVLPESEFSAARLGFFEASKWVLNQK